MSKYSKKAQESISAKLRKMADEDRPKKQKIAIDISEAKRKGYKVPDNK